ncbi:DgyrCDS1073 [Dimorphilus gyrociliatus]|uniref:DgyrCDS1073 n=1 Tax=Dimorphilus gyrociliatus TaxID=2664684 RepID=A0A7I8V885_9ANNE|nr:DgyrCDS1073 [Dimorphilus gyrociliatus]
MGNCLSRESVKEYPSFQGINLEDFPSNYPSPKVPKRRKKQLKVQRLRKFDINSVPSIYFTKSFEVLAKFLAKSAHNDFEKLSCLFSWLVQIDSTAVKNLSNELKKPALEEDYNSPIYHLLQIGEGLNNHARIFALLCRAIGIPCVIIKGHSKNINYHYGSSIDWNSLCCEWNAVYVNEQYFLIDAGWASSALSHTQSSPIGNGSLNFMDSVGLVKKKNTHSGQRIRDFYFLTDPDLFVCTHLPKDFRWQLLPTAISRKLFENLPYVRERFFEMNMTFSEGSYKEAVIIADRVESDLGMKFEFSSLKTFSASHLFTFVLYKCNLPTEKISDSVLFQLTSEKLTFFVRFPSRGKYRLDLFGIDKEKQLEIDLICSYVILNNIQRSYNKLPILSDFGWGPNLSMKDFGLAIPRYEEAVIRIARGDLEITIANKNDLKIIGKLVRKGVEETTLQSRLKQEVREGQSSFFFRLHKKGEYGFQLFAIWRGNRRNICNYLIILEEDCAINPFPRTVEGCIGKIMSIPSLQIRIEAKSRVTDWIFKTDENIEMEFKHHKDIELFAELTTNSMQSGILSKSKDLTCVKTINSTKITLSNTIPKEYGFNLFMTKTNKENKRRYLLQHVLSGILIVMDKTTESLPLTIFEIPVFRSVTSAPSMKIEMVLRDTPNLIVVKNYLEEEIAKENIQFIMNEYQTIQVNFKSIFGKYKIFIYKKIPKDGLVFLLYIHEIDYVSEENLKKKSKIPIRNSFREIDLTEQEKVEINYEKLETYTEKLRNALIEKQLTTFESLIEELKNENVSIFKFKFLIEVAENMLRRQSENNRKTIIDCLKSRKETNETTLEKIVCESTDLIKISKLLENLFEEELCDTHITILPSELKKSLVNKHLRNEEEILSAIKDNDLSKFKLAIKNDEKLHNQVKLLQKIYGEIQTREFESIHKKASLLLNDVFESIKKAELKEILEGRETISFRVAVDKMRSANDIKSIFEGYTKTEIHFSSNASFETTVKNELTHLQQKISTEIQECVESENIKSLEKIISDQVTALEYIVEEWFYDENTLKNFQHLRNLAKNCINKLIQRIKLNLEQSVSSDTDASTLQNIIKRVKRHLPNRELESQLQAAQKILEIKNFMQHRHIIPLNNSSIEEIKFILRSNPRDVLLKTVKASLLILNEPRQNLRSSENIGNIFARKSASLITDSHSELTRNVKIENAIEAMDLINEINIDAVERSTRSVTALYAKVKYITTLVICRLEQDKIENIRSNLKY